MKSNHQGHERSPCQRVRTGRRRGHSYQDSLAVNQPLGNLAGALQAVKGVLAMRFLVDAVMRTVHVEYLFRVEPGEVSVCRMSP